MGSRGNFSQCRLCRYFVEDDESLKNTIEYCILLGIKIDDSGDCPEFESLADESVSLKPDSDPEPVV